MKDKEADIKIINQYASLIEKEVSLIRLERSKLHVDEKYISILERNILIYWKQLCDSLDKQESSIHNYDYGADPQDAGEVIYDLTRIVTKIGYETKFKFS